MAVKKSLALDRGWGGVDGVRGVGSGRIARFAGDIDIIGVGIGSGGEKSG